ncbi:MAG: hypothetical protein WD027_08960 [Gaiellales bacterium]
MSSFAQRYNFAPTRATFVRAAAVYVGFMTLWIYGFANTERNLPGLLVFLLLVVPIVVHLGAGYVIGRQEALYLACFPPVLALLGPGIASGLWLSLFLLMIFPGAPLIAGGFGLRFWTDRNVTDENWY